MGGILLPPETSSQTAAEPTKTGQLGEDLLFLDPTGTITKKGNRKRTVLKAQEYTRIYLTPSMG